MGGGEVAAMPGGWCAVGSGPPMVRSREEGPASVPGGGPVPRT